MPIAYPNTLPIPLASSYTVEPYGVTVRAEMDAGSARQRAQNSTAPYKAAVRWLFSDAELAAFEAWHDDDISQGADEFTMRLLGGEGLETVTCRFLDSYKVERVQRHWGVTADLEARFTELTLAQYQYLLNPTGTPLSIALSAATSTESAAPGTATLSSDTITVTPTGGIEPITYAWTKISGDTFTLVNGSTAASQIFRTTDPGDEATYSAVYRVTATDWLGSTDAADITVTQTWLFADDADFASVSLLLHGDGANASTTITDSSSNAHTVTVAGNTQISTAQKVFRTGSIYFDGSGDYLTLPVDADFELRAGAFTIETRIRLASGVSGACMFSRMSTTNGITYEQLFTINADRIDVYYGIRGTNQSVTRLFFPATMALNAWHTVALQRDGSGNWAVYLDGVKGTQYQTAPLALLLVFGSVITGTYNNAVDLGSNSLVPTIGGNSQGFSPWNGYLDEYRLTKGVARYGASYTPAAYPFPDH